MYKHDMNREEVKKLPQIIREYRPVEETERGLKIYVTDNPSGNPYVVATNMKDGRRIVSSMYRDDNNPYRAFSNSRFEPMSDRGNIKIRTWKGAVLTVPPEKLADALKAGGQIIEVDKCSVNPVRNSCQPFLTDTRQVILLSHSCR